MPGWVCAQVGAREHYAVPRALLRRRLLAHLYTDAWAGPVLRRLGRRPLPRLADRYHAEIPDSRVTAFTGAALAASARDRLIHPSDADAVYKRYLAIGAAFARRVARRVVADRPAAFFAYTTGALEPVERLAELAVPTLVGQIDPARVEEEIVHRECHRWPGWAVRPGRIPDEYYARLHAEWRAATFVVVNSQWAQDALVAQGVPKQKLLVVPLAYDSPTAPPPVRRRPTRELVVLWLGQVILRKGIQYLFEAARLLRSSRIRVVVAGPLGISSSAVAAAPANVELLGPVPRSEIGVLYGKADVFVLPTLSDGFAITQLEAMAHGLPVVATPNCGRVVTDGEDGQIVPAADAEALAAALDRLAGSPDTIREMGQRARETASRYSVDALADRLENLHQTLTTSSSTGPHGSDRVPAWGGTPCLPQ